MRTDAHYGASENIYRKRLKPRDGAESSANIPNPARLLHFVLYGFLGVLLAGIILSVKTSSISPERSHIKIVDSQPESGQDAGVPQNTSGPIRHEATDSVPARVFVSTNTLPFAGWLCLSLLIVCIAILFPLGWRMMFKRDGSTARKVGGVALAATSLFSAKELTGALFKEVKIDALVKLEKPVLNLKWDGRDDRGAHSHFGIGADAIGTIGPFPVGHATLKDDQADSAFKAIIESLNKPSVRDQLALVMLVGSADRQGLRGAMRSRFDSNVGLAQARAEWVRKELVARFPDSTRGLHFLLLTSGPKRTDARMSAKDWQSDRSVEVWALWGGSLNAPSPAVAK